MEPRNTGATAPLTHHEAGRARRARESHSSSRSRQTLEGEVQASGKPTSVLVTYPTSQRPHHSPVLGVPSLQAPPVKGPETMCSATTGIDRHGIASLLHLNIPFPFHAQTHLQARRALGSCRASKTLEKKCEGRTQASVLSVGVPGFS